MRRISADIRPFTVTESFYSDAQYYDLAPEPHESKSVPLREGKGKQTAVAPPKEEPRFVVERQITPEMRQELLKDGARV